MQEFWEDVAFPTPASRVWERRGSESPESSPDQVSARSVSTNLSSSGRSHQQVEGVAGRSLLGSRPAARGVLIRPWKGPLPRPRPVQPVALASFWPETTKSTPAAAVASDADRDLVLEHAGVQTRVQPPGGDEPVMELHGGPQLCMATFCFCF